MTIIYILIYITGKNILMKGNTVKIADLGSSKELLGGGPSFSTVQPGAMVWCIYVYYIHT
jgi:hypothetical protein